MLRAQKRILLVGWDFDAGTTLRAGQTHHARAEPVGGVPLLAAVEAAPDSRSTS